MILIPVWLYFLLLMCLSAIIGIGIGYGSIAIERIVTRRGEK